MIRIHRAGDVLWIRLARPAARNAVTPEMLRDLVAVLDGPAESADVRVVVLRGEGEAAFSAGYDIGAIPEGAGAFAPEDLLDRATAAIEACSRPVIAMIHGYCLGGGCDLALACDVRLAAGSALFAVPAVRLGGVYPPGGVRRFLAVMGLAGVQELLLAGRQVGAVRAHALGLVHRVVPPGELDAEVARWSAELSRNGPLAMAATKALLRELRASGGASAERVQAWLDRVRVSRDAREGKRAFLEKRAPRFTGS